MYKKLMIVISILSQHIQANDIATDFLGTLEDCRPNMIFKKVNCLIVDASSGHIVINSHANMDDTAISIHNMPHMLAQQFRVSYASEYLSIISQQNPFIDDSYQNNDFSIQIDISNTMAINLIADKNAHIKLNGIHKGNVQAIADNGTIKFTGVDNVTSNFSVSGAGKIWIDDIYSTEISCLLYENGCINIHQGYIKRMKINTKDDGALTFGGIAHNVLARSSSTNQTFIHKVTNTIIKKIAAYSHITIESLLHDINGYPIIDYQMLP